VNRQRTIILFVLAGLFGRPVRAEDTLPPSIIHEACSEYQKGKPFDIIARFEDESQLFDPKVMYRASGDSHWKQAPFTKMPASEDFKATIKVKDLKGTLEYFIEVFDEFGNGPARMGSPEAAIKVAPAKSPEPCEQIPAQRRSVAVAGSSAPTPPEPEITTPKPAVGAASGGGALSQPVPPPVQATCDRQDRPLYCEAWLWGTLGVVVAAAGGVGLYFLLRPSDQPPTRSSSVRLQVTGPDPTGNY